MLFPIVWNCATLAAAAILGQPTASQSSSSSPTKKRDKKKDSTPEGTPPRNRKPPPPSPHDKIVEHLRDQMGDRLDETLIAWVPTKYERYGHVLLVPPPPNTSECDSWPPELGLAVCEVLKVRCVVVVSRSGGELRTPTAPCVLFSLDSPPVTETQHTEDGIVYTFDVAKVMWSSGNVKERTRIGSDVVVSGVAGQTVLDMFAGIGYFSLPLAVKGAKSIAHHVAIEKNPDSFVYLQKNFEHYKAKGRIAPHTLLCGDNHDVGDEYVGRCDRILMGYLPDTEKFIPRAIEFLRPNVPCTLHFHYLHGAREDGAGVAEAHFREVLDRGTACFHDEAHSQDIDGNDEDDHLPLTRSSGGGSGRQVTFELPPASPRRVYGRFTLRVDEVRVIKSYAPNVVHAVADVSVTIHEQ
eukprot:PhM_4_TR15825/c0_g1_i1/m.95568/K07055/TRM12, TYW2; tRNA wybutosine-synthesizing protein 2